MIRLNPVIKLNQTNRRKFGLRLNFITEYFLRYFFWSATFFVSLMFIISLIPAYLDPNSGYYFVLVIFWCIITVLWAIHFYGVLAFIGCFWFLTTLFLKYKFTEIHETIKRSVKTHDKISLLQSIHFHNNLSLFTKQLNKFFNVFIFIVYYFGTLSMELILYTTHEKSSVFSVRFAMSLVCFVIFSAMVFMTGMSANVIHSAHKSYPLLFQFLIENNLTIRERLQIFTFIEYLSSPQIGFYCLDLFPMNNSEFFRYLAGTLINYLLILTII